MGINTYSTTIIIWCSGVQWSIVLLLFTKHRHYSARGKKKLFFMPISKGLTNFRVNGKRWSNFVSSLCELPFNLCNKRINFVHPGKTAHTSWVNSDLIFFCNFAVEVTVLWHHFRFWWCTSTCNLLQNLWNGLCTVNYISRL